MKADVKTLYDLTAGDVRYLVPRYQRPYVWTEEKHWEPLWADIETAVSRLDKGEARDHFLGAIVLKGTTPIPGEPLVYDVIDGQQRLTTTQIILAAASNVARDAGVDKAARLLGRMVRNDEDMAEGEKLFKLWPTRQDRDSFRLIASEGGPPDDAEDDPNNTIQEAYDYFRRVINEAVIGDGSDVDEAARRLELLRSALSSVFKVVAIVLEDNDEAQVIFETLNARGTPLLALDLVKNAVFQAADLDRTSVEELHDLVWEPELGLPYWREEIRQGRLTRPRAELFLIHWMTMKLALRGTIKEPIRSDRVFQTFGAEILKDPDSPGAEAIVKELVRDARIMRQLDEVDEHSPEGRFLRTTAYLDTTVFYPVILYLYSTTDVSAQTRREVLEIIESVQIRRTLMSFLGKGYSQIAIELLGEIGQGEDSPEVVVRRFFEDRDAKRSNWPSDGAIRERLIEKPAYRWVKQSKLVGILAEIERDLRRNGFSEEPFNAEDPLSIEHVMPQTWETNWAMESPTSEMIEVRNDLIQTIGNLTLVTGRMNSSLSNESWPEKRARFRDHSVLLLNREIARNEVWDEDAIRTRSELLADRIVELWPGPSTDESSSGEPGTSLVEVHPGGSFSDEDLQDAFETCTNRYRQLLVELADSPGLFHAFSEMEAGLGWAPGSLPAVFAGFTSSHPELGSRRPYDTAKDRESNWLIRMSQETAEAIKALPDELLSTNRLSPRDALRREFFTELLKVSNEMNDVFGGVTAPTGDWAQAGAGRSGVHWIFRISPLQTSVELALEHSDGDLNRLRFGELEANAELVETAFGDELEWDAPEGRKRCSIKRTIELGGYESPKDKWPEILAMTAESMKRLENAVQVEGSGFTEMG